MKVLFLDIDGVLNSHRSFIAANNDAFPDLSIRGMKKIDHVGVGLLRKMCSLTDIKIVVSSTWRMGHTVDELAKAFDLPIIDATPVLDTIRGHEIQHWLDRHPDVTNYAIVDDDSDMLESQLPFFVKTSHYDGVTWKNHQQMCSLLGVNEFGEPGPLTCVDKTL